MKLRAKIIIILISFVLCCSLIGGAFAVYSVNASLDISFSGKPESVVEYFLEISENDSLVAKLKLNAENETSSVFTTSAYLKDGYTLSFYENDKLLTQSTDYTVSADSSIDVSGTIPYEFNYFVSYTKNQSGNDVVNFALDTSYYLVGTFNDWAITDEYRFTVNSENANEVMLLSANLPQGSAFKIRNYNGYYSTAKDESPEIFTVDSDNNVVPRNGGTYDFYFDTVNNSVYFKNSAVTYTTITSYQNSSWILSSNAWLVAVGSDGKFYKIAYKSWGENDITVNVYVPSTLASVTVMRASPTVTYDNYNIYKDNASYVWNKITIQKSAYGSNAKIWS